MRRPLAQRSPVGPTPGPASGAARSVGNHEAFLTGLLLVVAALAWWATLRLARDMGGMGFALFPFLIGWTAMMAAMMLPAVTPVVRLYARAAAVGRVAPAGYFTVGYLAVWVVSGLPAAGLGLLVEEPLMDGRPWALRAAGAALLVAGLYQLSPWKRACLRHCRSPLGYFMRSQRPLDRPLGALRAGATHGLYCLGCCVGLMLVLVTAAAMQPLWAAVIATAVFIERNLRHGETFSSLLALALVPFGASVLIHPALIEGLVQGVLA